ncbi:hypothetical protein B8W69_03630 [Mycobacterium vulneris]|uniref:GGDEF domain-containing protein n=1 Tax=Mycolicibacterium vulneris TaxID=547163 RepID=A0A1X2LC03_9MYCO|nr:hypothetical protein B8W69_03630 [Mycolicibacterium vulneris]
MVSTLNSHQLAALSGLNLLILVSVYIKFFDGPKLLATHTVWSLGWVLVFSYRIATGAHADPYLATAKALAGIAVWVATPIAVHFGIWVLRGGADSAMTDELTGLLNRRGLHLLLNGLVAGNPAHNAPADTTVMIMVIDLDRFKEINDTYGHVVGDDVLIRTARRIKAAMRNPALIARIGGQEFVVIDVVAPHHVTLIAERVRSVIAAPADHAHVTASIGVTTVSREQLTNPLHDTAASLEQAITRADHAMFTVKRQGGNATTIIADSSPLTPGSGPLNPA